MAQTTSRLGNDLDEVEEVGSRSSRGGGGLGAEEGSRNEAAYLRTRKEKGLSLSHFARPKLEPNRQEIIHKYICSTHILGLSLYLWRWLRAPHYLVAEYPNLGGPVAPPPILLRARAGGFFISCWIVRQLAGTDGN